VTAAAPEITPLDNPVDGTDRKRKRTIKLMTTQISAMRATEAQSLMNIVEFMRDHHRKCHCADHVVPDMNDLLWLLGLTDEPQGRVVVCDREANFTMTLTEQSTMREIDVESLLNVLDFMKDHFTKCCCADHVARDMENLICSLGYADGPKLGGQLLMELRDAYCRDCMSMLICRHCGSVRIGGGPAKFAEAFKHCSHEDCNTHARTLDLFCPRCVPDFSLEDDESNARQ